MTDLRDTHFAGFADRLFWELHATGDVSFDNPHYYWSKQWKQVIARAAYDLVAHTILNTEHISLDRLSTPEHVERIPDLPEWGKEVPLG